MNDEKDLIKITENPENYIKRNGVCWKYDLKDRYNSLAYRIDKEIQQRIVATILKKYKPQHGVLSVNDKAAFLIASRHAEDKIILKFDIKKFYNNINFDLVKKFLKKEFNEKELEFIKNFYFDDDGLRRGLFASSIISEIVGIKLDNVVEKILFDHGWKDVIKYSRYCDDLIFSDNSLENLKELECQLTNEISMLGLTPNNKKTKILWTTSAKILGLRIHNGKIVTPKRYRNKVRVRMKYADEIVREVLVSGYENVNDIERAMSAVGTVIGSLEYILKNSTDVARKYESMMEYYCEVFSKLKQIENGERIDENPFIDNGFDISKIRAEALELIYNNRYPWREISEDDLAQINEVLQSLPAVEEL